MNKKLIIIHSSVLVVVVHLGVGAYFLTSTPDEDNGNQLDDENYTEIQPEDVGFGYTLRPDGSGIVLTFDKLEGVETLEYDLSYTKEIEGKDGSVEAPGGVPGEVNVSGKSSYESDIDFGTCSSGRCIFDTIVSPQITIIVRVGYEDGTTGIFQVEVPYEVEE